MKTYSNKAFYKIILLLFCFYGFVTYAEKTDPPAPAQKGTAAAAKFDPPPGTPIDENITLLLLAAVLFGTYTIYKYKTNKKRPI